MPVYRSYPKTSVTRQIATDFEAIRSCCTRGCAQLRSQSERIEIGEAPCRIEHAQDRPAARSSDSGDFAGASAPPSRRATTSPSRHTGAHLRHRFPQIPRSVPTALLRSITWDQGTEIVRQLATTDRRGAPVCSCDSRSPGSAAATRTPLPRKPINRTASLQQAVSAPMTTRTYPSQGGQSSRHRPRLTQSSHQKRHQAVDVAGAGPDATDANRASRSQTSLGNAHCC